MSYMGECFISILFNNYKVSKYIMLYLSQVFISISIIQRTSSAFGDSPSISNEDCEVSGNLHILLTDKIQVWLDNLIWGLEKNEMRTSFWRPERGTTLEFSSLKGIEWSVVYSIKANIYGTDKIRNKSKHNE
jgi:hypothetical protein